MPMGGRGGGSNICIRVAIARSEFQNFPLAYMTTIWGAWRIRERT